MEPEGNGFMLLLQETHSILDSINRPKMKFIAIFTFHYKYKKNRNYNLGNKTVFLLKYVFVFTVLFES